MKRQDGMAQLIAIAMVLTLVSFGLSVFAEFEQTRRIKGKVDSLYSKVSHVRGGIHEYVMDKLTTGTPVNSAAVFPPTLSSLQPVYLPSCSVANANTGNCSLIDDTPWGKMIYRVERKTSPGGDHFYQSRLTIPLPSKTDSRFTEEHQISVSMLAELPLTTWDETNNRLEVVVQRPESAIVYEGLVKRTGDDSTLTGDWDAGGSHGITNLKDISLRTNSGNQTSISDKLWQSRTVTHGTWVTKPDCPVGRRADINLAPNAIIISSLYEATGNQRGYVMAETPTRWQVGLEVYVKRKTDGALLALRSGDVFANFGCKP
ncbi:hypothetical protein VNTUMSATTG_61140 (plasmid) [Vibrio nigripulchritudo]|uniref:hypothetical protein n=1 Tax=Vibrio nigripulchritudo TaxID=28173 RepID=UPI00190C4263|nr:hypothetical protein [Vibrio nigripulchritudo]BCL74177.1 hypothetical protein VNTUMSATTG_61140 [Vibrio nigripulchritudo]